MLEFLSRGNAAWSEIGSVGGGGWTRSAACGHFIRCCRMSGSARRFGSRCPKRTGFNSTRWWHGTQPWRRPTPERRGSRFRAYSAPSSRQNLARSTGWIGSAARRCNFYVLDARLPITAGPVENFPARPVASYGVSTASLGVWSPTWCAVLNEFSHFEECLKWPPRLL
jgi:hypothetical protein